MTELERWDPDMTAAPKDGSVIEVKREHEGRTMGPYRAVWGQYAADAEMRQWGDGGLDAPIPPNHEFADRFHWMREDRQYRVPEPTHWRMA